MTHYLERNIPIFVSNIIIKVKKKHVHIKCLKLAPKCPEISSQHVSPLRRGFLSTTDFQKYLLCSKHIGDGFITTDGSLSYNVRARDILFFVINFVFHYLILNRTEELRSYLTVFAQYIYIYL